LNEGIITYIKAEPLCRNHSILVTVHGTFSSNQVLARPDFSAVNGKLVSADHA
jgi:hypothetical protein